MLGDKSLWFPNNIVSTIVDEPFCLELVNPYGRGGLSERMNIRAHIYFPHAFINPVALWFRFTIPKVPGKQDTRRETI
jgi:hypothetical protein